MPYIPKQYDSAKEFLRGYTRNTALGNIVDPDDNSRINAYNLYEDFYYNRPETFKVTVRGDSDTEIYLPSTKKLVEASARFLAVDFSYLLEGADKAVEKAVADLFAREEITRRFIKGKRSMLIRGDMFWYITADPTKPLGTRISINTIHPSCVFRIEDPHNAFRVLGYHLVDLVDDFREPGKGKRLARRQTYLKEKGRITSEAILFEVGAWDDRRLKPDELKPVKMLHKKFELPSSITELPLYHIPNNEPDGSSWGLSQVAGIEYLINALNQSVTYEDLSLVLQGLGVYVSTAGPPIDSATGRPSKYQLGPGDVVEISQEDKFERVTGISSVAPFQDHMKFLDQWATDGIGLPDMATGTVDVSVAQSGIALALKMGPIIAENSDKQLGIKSRWDQLGHDLLHMWFPAYEGLASPGAEWETVFGDPMPINRDQFIQETIDLFTADMITYEEMRDRLETVGYEQLPGAELTLLEQAAKKADASAGMGLMNEGRIPVPEIPSDDDDDEQLIIES